MNNPIHIGEAINYGALSVFPVFARSTGVDYELANDAMAAGSVVVEETSDSGSVPELSVENKGDLRVLFLEGEELVGAKQNRVLNTSVLVPARSKIKIPVSCVERGRWQYRSRGFESSGCSSPASTRLVLCRSVSESLSKGRGHHSDQAAVWNAVGRQHRLLGVASSTHAYSDTVKRYRGRISDYQKNIPYVAGASGLVVAVDGKSLALDFFDKPSTCQKVWPKLLTGFAIDALQAKPDASQPDAAAVERFVDSAIGASWNSTPPVGEGEAYRADIATDIHGSKLTLRGSIVHASVLNCG